MCQTMIIHEFLTFYHSLNPIGHRINSRIRINFPLWRAHDHENWWGVGLCVLLHTWCTMTCCLSYSGCCGECASFLSLQCWFSCVIILLMGWTMTTMSIVDCLQAPWSIHTITGAAFVEVPSWSISILIYGRVWSCWCSNHSSHMTLCEWMMQILVWLSVGKCF